MNPQTPPGSIGFWIKIPKKGANRNCLFPGEPNDDQKSEEQRKKEKQIDEKAGCPLMIHLTI